MQDFISTLMPDSRLDFVLARCRCRMPDSRLDFELARCRCRMPDSRSDAVLVHCRWLPMVEGNIF